MPQNRERVFVVSILGEHKPYIFPQKQELKLMLNDVLEDEVDKKYYLSDEQVKRISASTFVQDKRRIQEKDWCDTLCARDYKDPKCVKIQQIEQYNTPEDDGINPAYPDNKTKHDRVQEYSGFVIGSTQKNAYVGDLTNSPTLTSAMGTGGGHIPMIGASRGRILKNSTSKEAGLRIEQRLEINKNGTSNCLTTVQKDNLVIEPIGTLAAHNSESFGNGYMEGLSKTLKAEKYDISVVYSDLRIRKLTPLECWRLMSFTDEDFEKAQQSGVSNSQLYKQAGNSIVVKVLEGIFRELFKRDDYEK